MKTFVFVRNLKEMNDIWLENQSQSLQILCLLHELLMNTINTIVHEDKRVLIICSQVHTRAIIGTMIMYIYIYELFLINFF